MFLFKLGEKVFNYLSKDSTAKAETKIGADNKDNVIEWLKAKLGGEDLGATQDWEKFKSICTKAMKDEDEISTLLTNKDKPEVRLCFMGVDMTDLRNAIDPEKKKSINALQLLEAHAKGRIYLWSYDQNSDGEQPYGDLEAFQYNSWDKSNYDLWTKFKLGHGSSVAYQDSTDFSTFESSWDEWYKTAYSYGSYSNSSSSKKLSEALKPSS